MEKVSGFLCDAVGDEPGLLGLYAATYEPAQHKGMGLVPGSSRRALATATEVKGIGVSGAANRVRPRSTAGLGF